MRSIRSVAELGEFHKQLTEALFQQSNNPNLLQRMPDFPFVDRVLLNDFVEYQGHVTPPAPAAATTAPAVAEKPKNVAVAPSSSSSVAAAPPPTSSQTRQEEASASTVVPRSSS